ncbi:MAG TPA: flavodoxin family protein [candidate division Zixibacteria bacterium]|nr:flavodoxin family protein [candidate division Zixibacteria bacterium]
MKKILIFNGSPRKKGNTAVLIEECLRGIREAGSDAEIFVLNKMKIKPCQFCDWCIKNNMLTCVKKDDMSELYPKLIESDAIIIASPIFWFNISAQMKLFIDRLYALHGKGGFAIKNKKVASILVYADNNVESSGVKNAIKTLQDIFTYMKSDIIAIVHGTAAKIGDAEKNKQLMSEAYQLGATIGK